MPRRLGSAASQRARFDRWERTAPAAWLMAARRSAVGDWGQAWPKSRSGFGCALVATVWRSAQVRIS